jgi:hypothetical protein
MLRSQDHHLLGREDDIMTAKLRIGLPKYIVLLSSKVSFDGFDGSFDHPFDGYHII